MHGCFKLKLQQLALFVLHRTHVSAHNSWHKLANAQTQSKDFRTFWVNQCIDSGVVSVHTKAIKNMQIFNEERVVHFTRYNYFQYILMEIKLNYQLKTETGIIKITDKK